MKTVYPSYEVPHLWANQTQEHARGGNIFFRGPVIFSYGEHFPMARFVTRNGKRAVLFNEARYSVTTSSHQSATWSAIPHGVPVFEVKDLGGHYENPTIDHKVNLACYRSRITLHVENAARARTHGQWELEQARELAKEANAYAEFYGLKARFDDLLPAGDALGALRKKLVQRAAKEALRTKKANAERAAREAEQERILALALAEKITLWRAGSPDVDSWQLNGAPTMLRIIGEEVQTSRGARFPLDHAKRGLSIVRAVMSSGREYVRNGHTVHLGVYALDRIEVNGTVHAGCHVVPWSEIERIAPELDAR